MAAYQNTAKSKSEPRPSVPESVIRAAVDRTAVEVAPNPAEPVPNLDVICHTVMDECDALLLIKDSLKDVVDLGYDHVLTESDAERIHAVWNQLYRCRARLVALSLVLDDADTNYELAPNEHERKRLRLVAAEPRAAEVPDADPDFSGDLRGVTEHLRSVTQRLPSNEELSTIAQALERLCERFDGLPSPEKPTSADLPEVLARHISDQQARLYELEELLEVAAQSDGGCNPLSGVLTMASRAAREASSALDSATLKRVLQAPGEGAAPPPAVEEASGKQSTVDGPLAGTARLLRAAVSVIGESDAAALPSPVVVAAIGELVSTAAERLRSYISTLSTEDGSAAFDALDACTAVTALIEGGLDPRNGKTISPIRGVLWMAVERLEGAL